MQLLTHPKCQKQFPNSSRTGHCSGCCETFIGIEAFDAHRVGNHGADRRCEIQPYETTGDDGKVRYGHWQDERGYWHHGKRLTQAEKDRIFGGRAAS